MNFNGPILEALSRWLRFDEESLLQYPPGQAERVLVEWALLMVELWVLLALVRWGWRSWRKRPGPVPAEAPQPGKGRRRKQSTEVQAAPPAPSPVRRIVHAATVAVGGIAITLAVIEWAVATYVATQQMPTMIPHPLYMWRYRPNLRSFQMPTPVGPMYFDTNGEGLRNADVPAVKDPGELRVIVLGDSHTFGQSVDYDKIYSTQLEALLGKQYPGKKIRVINGGVNGYSLLQGYYLLEQELMKYQPDLVVVNEFNEFSNGQVKEFDTVVPRGWLERKVKELLWRSQAYMTVRKLMAPRRVDHEIQAPQPQSPTQQMLPDDESVEYIQRFIKLFKDHRIKGIFVMYRRPGYWNSTYQRLLAGEDPHRLVAVDYNAFLLQQNGSVFWLPNDPSWHPSAQGHFLMAQALLQTIVQNKMLGP